MSSILLRRHTAGVGGSSGEVLDGYHFNGSTYFNTGVLLSSNDNIECIFSCTNDAGGTMALFGTRIASNSQNIGFLLNTGAAYTTRYANRNTYSTYWANFDYHLAENATYKIVTNGKTASLYENDVFIHTYSDPTSSRYAGSGYPLFVGAFNTSGDPSYYGLFVGDIYSLKVFNNDRDIANFVPVANGMRDTIGGNIISPIII